MDREPDPEPAEEISENGPLLGWWAVDVFVSFKKHKLPELNSRRRNKVVLIVQPMATGSGVGLSVKQTELYTKIET